MGRKLVCICNFVTENEIVEALKKGAKTTADIQKLTRAGTSCGRCLMTIDGMVEDYLSNQAEDPQKIIEFEEWKNLRKHDSN